MRAGDVIVDAQGFADSNSDRLFAAVEVSESGHESARVDLVHLLFELADANHLAVGVKPLFFFSCGGLANFFSTSLGLGGCRRHNFFRPFVTGVATPDMAASTSNMQAKSYLVQPMPRAPVRISLLSALLRKAPSNFPPQP